jgi:flagellar biosynthesis component FlhA
METTRASTPQVNATVQLPIALSALLDAIPLRAAIAGAIESALAALLVRYGVPGTIQLTLTADGTDAPPAKFLRLKIGGETVRYGDELLQHAWCYAHAVPLDPQVNAAFVQTRLAELANALDEADSSPIVEFFALISAQALEMEPALLLNEAQCAAYSDALDPAPAVGVEGLRRVLRQLLALHISIANRGAIAEALAEDGSEQSVVERLVTALRRNSIDIHLSKTSVRDLTTSLAGDASTLFPFLRDGLFSELGIPMPRYRFVIDDGQRTGSFAFRANDFVSIPLFSLPPGTIMVNDSEDRLRVQGFTEARSITNPATGQPNALIAASRDQEAQALGFTTWSRIGHLILSFAEFLRRHGWCTVDRTGVETQLRTLASAYPVLVETVGARCSADAVTAVTRALVRDRVSAQNLRGVLESLLDFDMAERSARGTNTPPHASPEAVARVRVGLGPAIAHVAARRTDTVVVYLLDPAIERLASASDEEFDAQAEQILGALRNELAYLPPTAQVPCVLTAAASRHRLQRLIAREHPRMMVIAHEELPPYRNVQPVARISL